MTGDGIHTIRELVEIKQDVFIRDGRDTEIDITDPRMRIVLERRGYSLDTIAKKMEEVPLLDNANLSSGGESIDVTETLHEDFRKIAITATRDM